jgi:hypothetical protein
VVVSPARLHQEPKPIVAGCAGAMQIFLDLMSDWMRSSELPQRALTVRAASSRDEAPASLKSSLRFSIHAKAERNWRSGGFSL